MSQKPSYGMNTLIIPFKVTAARPRTTSSGPDASSSNSQPTGPTDQRPTATGKADRGEADGPEVE